jgi:hypothetical protein
VSRGNQHTILVEDGALDYTRVLVEVYHFVYDSPALVLFFLTEILNSLLDRHILLAFDILSFEFIVAHKIIVFDFVVRCSPILPALLRAQLSYLGVL